MSAERLKRVTVNAAFFQEIKEDHQLLQKLLADLNELVGNRVYLDNRPREFLGLLDQLVDQLGLHFTLEEAYGYFEHAVEDSPRFHETAVKLRDQHSELYLTLQRIAEACATECGKSEPQLDKLIDEFIAFHAALESHETAEQNLILEALNRDVGVGD